MCDQDSSDDILRGNELSRRQFGALGLGATLAAMLPAVAAQGANHGWMPPDSQNHNAAAAERGWERKLELFKKALA